MDNREANFAGHPPYCTCVDCINKRLEKLGPGEIPRLQKCPECKQKSLFWNKNFALFECLNLQCKKIFAPGEINQDSVGLDSPHSGRAWFGNESFDSEDRKWEKPKNKVTSLRGLKNVILILVVVSIVGYMAPNIYNKVVSLRHSNEEYVEINGARLVGADGKDIILVNNSTAHNPTWSELKQFLLKDNTDRIPYSSNSFVCADFAEMLHNNAENAGIRAAYVSIHLSSYSEGHSLNAFNTTDRGLIYIDDTGTETGNINADKIVTVAKGSEYVPVSIFPNPGYESQWESMGTVTDIWIEW